MHRILNFYALSFLAAALLLVGLAACNHGAKTESATTPAEAPPAEPPPPPQPNSPIVTASGSLHMVDFADLTEFYVYDKDQSPQTLPRRREP